MGLCRTNLDIAMALRANRETHLAQAALGQTFAERTQLEAKRQRWRLAGVREEEARLGRKRQELGRAATVAESTEAVKKLPDEATGIGHLRGGAKVHREARNEILNRLRLRAKALPQNLANDWDWFVSKLDTARVERLEGHFKGQWGMMFRDAVVRLVSRIQAGDRTRWPTGCGMSAADTRSCLGCGCDENVRVPPREPGLCSEGGFRDVCPRPRKSRIPLKQQCPEYALRFPTLLFQNPSF
jgi:hypothetical protein